MEMKPLESNNSPGMHINDSKSGLGSKADRHENIGKGMLV